MWHKSLQEILNIFNQIINNPTIAQHWSAIATLIMLLLVLIPIIRKLLFRLVKIFSILIKTAKRIKRNQDCKEKENSNEELYRGNHKLSSLLPPIEGFIGRQDKIEQTIYSLKNKNISLIKGLGGIGKSALAKKIGAICEESELFDAVIWISSRRNKITKEDIFTEIYKSANLFHAFKAEAAEKEAMVSMLLNKYSILLIIDNYDTIQTDIEISEFIEKIHSPSRVLITSRELPENIPNFKLIELNEMTDDDSLFFLETHARDIELTGLTKKQFGDIAKATGCIPLAMEWALGQIKQKAQSFETIIDYLSSAKGDLFKEIFDYSWQMMADHDRLLLMTLGICFSSITHEACQKISGIKTDILNDSIPKLKMLSLIETDNQISIKEKRYDLHPLTRTFAVEKLRQNSNLDSKLRKSNADYYYSFILKFGGEKWDWKSFNELEGEYENISKTIDWYLAIKDWERIKKLRNQLTLFLSIRGHWAKRIELANQNLKACKATGDMKGYANCLVYDLVYIDLKYNNLEIAEIRVKQGLKIAKENKDNLTIANAIRHLGRIYHLEGKYEKAEELYQKSYEIYVGEDPEYGAFLQWDLGDLYYCQQRFNEAEEMFLKALKESKNRKGKCESVQAMANRYIGDIYKQKKDWRKAKRYYIEGLTFAKKMGRADEMALSYGSLTKLHMNSYFKNKRQIALNYAEKAMNINYQIWDLKAYQEYKSIHSNLQNNINGFIF